ncbi:MAG: hypothetical protein HDR22_04940 [Lachnospiraceae bacterium]|nr:hypothetical protein [Lachnospiraceae bacterium]
MDDKQLSELEKLQAEKEEFQKEMKNWTEHIRYEKERLKQERSFFDTKFKILEAEFQRLAREQESFKREKEEFERQKAYSRSYSHKEYREFAEDGQIAGDFYKEQAFFFKGVTNPLGLKKRYKDLIKIFHPDNLFGDTETITKINLEYEKMREYLQVTNKYEA